MSNDLEQNFQNNQIMSGNVQPGTTMQAVATSREIEEVKGQIFMAKQFPRNTYQAQKRIEDACKRKTLAETALYSYPRGGQNVTGPSIRLAEVLAQNWGNMAFGFKEIESNEQESTVMAYAWDVETNTRQERIFQQPHYRYTRSGSKHLTDPRDIYELVANNASRRVRACILSIIPGDIVEDAIAECNKTLTGNNAGPLKERLKTCLDLFKDKFDVTQAQVEARFGYGISEFTAINMVQLGNIYNSLKDNQTKVKDWFEDRLPEPDTDDKLGSSLETKFANGKAKDAGSKDATDEAEKPKKKPAAKKTTAKKVEGETDDDAKQTDIFKADEH
jgi:hypothetical protein